MKLLAVDTLNGDLSVFEELDWNNGEGKYWCCQMIKEKSQGGLYQILKLSYIFQPQTV